MGTWRSLFLGRRRRQLLAAAARIEALERELEQARSVRFALERDLKMALSDNRRMLGRLLTAENQVEIEREKLHRLSKTVKGERRPLGVEKGDK